MKFLTVLSGIALAFLITGVVSSASHATPTTDGARLVIHHAAIGCHTWTLGGGDPGAAHTLVLRQGQSFTVENRDNCGHQLVQVSGPERAPMTAEFTRAPATGLLPSLRPGVRVVLDKVGTYTFTTTERDDLAYGADTDTRFGFAKLSSSGPDTTLSLVVRVTPNRTHATD